MRVWTGHEAPPRAIPMVHESLGVRHAQGPDVVCRVRCYPIKRPRSGRTRTGSRLRGHQPRQDPRVDPVRDTREGSEERGLRLGARTDRARRHSGREGAAPPLRVRRHDRRHRTVRERLSADVVEASRVTRARAVAHGDDQHAALALGVGREEPRGLVVVEGESGRAVAVRVSPEVDPPGADPASSCAARSPRAPSAPSPLIP